MQKLERIEQLHTGDLVFFDSHKFIVLGITNVSVENIYYSRLCSLDEYYMNTYTVNSLYKALLKECAFMLYPIETLQDLESLVEEKIYLARPFFMLQSGRFEKCLTLSKVNLLKTKLMLLGVLNNKDNMTLEDAKEALKVQYKKAEETRKELLKKYTKRSSKKTVGMMFYTDMKNPFRVQLYVSIGQKGKNIYFLQLKSYPVLQLDRLENDLNVENIISLLYRRYLDSFDFKIVKYNEKLKPLGVRVENEFSDYSYRLTTQQKEKLATFKELIV